MINAAEIADLQRTVVSALRDTCKIQRRTTTEDDFGSVVETWSTIATTVCDVDLSVYHPIEQEVGAREMAVARWLVKLPAGTDVQEADRLIIRGETYEVIEAGSRSIELYRRVLAETRR